MSESFTREELRLAASRLGHVVSMDRILTAAAGNGEASLDEERLRYWLGYGCEWLTEIVAEARRLRQPPIANDEDELTVGELRAWLERQLSSPSRIQFTTSLTRDSIDKIMADIHAHREPDYPAGTVVQDADGIDWKRKGAGWSKTIWSVSVSPLSAPVRPLTVL